MIVREYEPDDFQVHRIPLMLMGGFVAISLALATSVSLGLFERQSVVTQARADLGTQPVETRSIVFFDEADGTVRVDDAANGETIARFGPGTGGFVRSTARSLVHERRIRGIGRATPFELIEWDDGGLTLLDPATDESVELAFFGADNRAVFADMLKDMS